MAKVREDKVRALVAALRAIPEDGRPYRVPGDGEFLWNYNLFMERAEDLDDPNEQYNLPEGWCGTVGCAAGLAALMRLSPGYEPAEVADALGIPFETAERIFRNPSTYGVDWDDVTPAMVADELEALLED